jgi:dienelactone hydrolase
MSHLQPIKSLLLIKLIFLMAAGFSSTLVSATGVEVSWEKSHVFIPGRSSRVKISEIPSDKAYPVIIYLHGCSGIAPNHGGRWGEYLSSWGFIAILPDSMARPGRYSNCEQKTHTTGSFPQAHLYRQQEIAYAIEQLKQSPWADKNNVYLFGHSEGGVAAAEYSGSFFKGLIISGWNCAFGITSPDTVPVLAVAFNQDPWFRLSGRCSKAPWSKREITRVDLPGPFHDTVWVQEAREAAFDFLKARTTNHQIAQPKSTFTPTRDDGPEEVLQLLN